MIEGANGAYLGLLSFLSFAFSVMAAVMAIDLYALMRTSQFGKSWRILIIASVMFALMHALRMAELLNWSALDHYQLSEIVELMFVMSLAYAFYLQRSVFWKAARERSARERTSEAESHAVRSGDAPEGIREEEWARLSGTYTGGDDSRESMLWSQPPAKAVDDSKNPTSDAPEQWSSRARSASR